MQFRTGFLQLRGHEQLEKGKIKSRGWPIVGFILSGDFTQREGRYRLLCLHCAGFCRYADEKVLFHSFLKAVSNIEDRILQRILFLYRNIERLFDFYIKESSEMIPVMDFSREQSQPGGNSNKPDILTCRLTAKMALTLRECLCGLALKYRQQEGGGVVPCLGGSDSRTSEQPQHPEERMW